MREIFKSGSVGRAPGNRCLCLEPDGENVCCADAASALAPLVMQVDKRAKLRLARLSRELCLQHQRLIALGKINLL